MNTIELKVNTNSQKYSIIIGSGLAGKISMVLNKNSIKFDKCLLVIDNKIPKALINKVLKSLPKKRQNLLFSATMPPKIRTLATKLLDNPASISLAISKPAEGITQSAYMCHDSQKVNLVREILKAKGKGLSHVLIFASSI